MSPLSWGLIVWPKIRSLVLYWPSHCGNINRPQGLYLGEQSETFPNSLILITCDFNCFPITQIFLFLISTSKHVTSKYLNSTQFEIYFIGFFFFLLWPFYLFFVDDLHGPVFASLLVFDLEHLAKRSLSNFLPWFIFLPYPALIIDTSVRNGFHICTAFATHGQGKSLVNCK